MALASLVALVSLSATARRAEAVVRDRSGGVDIDRLPRRLRHTAQGIISPPSLSLLSSSPSPHLPVTSTVAYRSAKRAAMDAVRGRGRTGGTTAGGGGARGGLSVPQRILAGGIFRSAAQLLLYPVDALQTLAQTRDSHTLSDVGTKALVRGCGTTFSIALIMGASQFAICGSTRDAVGPLLASALGAAGSCVVSVPQEVIKQRLATVVYDSFRHAVGTIYIEEDIGGF